MTLTDQNMKTNEKSWDVGAVWEDIARMDDGQLETFVGKAFTGSRDLDFLPRPFWDHYFDMDAHGPSEDGRSKPGPASFLAELHDVIGLIESGLYSTPGYKPDFEYRPRFRKVIDKLLDKCLAIEGLPNDEQRLLTVNAVEAAGSIHATFSQYTTSPERNSKPLQIPEILRGDLEILEVQRSEMLKKAESLIKGEKFGELKLDYQ